MTTDSAASAADTTNVPDDPEDLLVHLTKVHLRATASPLQHHPGAMGWQATAGALAAWLLDHVIRDNPLKADAIATLYSGPLGEGPDLDAEVAWIGRVVAGPAGANLQDWITEAEQQARAAQEAQA
ncbi:hypothetical protein [Streptomyces sp. NPDC001404]|uniref:hypothetical protein n=1 Tax=Streptomyces sp. NPDC001404 TaxID=3364571 RepID=UPI00369A54E7